MIFRGRGNYLLIDAPRIKQRAFIISAFKVMIGYEGA